MTHRIWTLAVALPLLLLGCSNSSDNSNRGPLGKTDNIGSCLDSFNGGDFCGGPSDAACYCDSECDYYGDCCDDKAVVCDGATCTDGSTLTCRALPAPCEPGLIREIVNSCWGECVHPTTCAPPIHQGCGDGTLPVCEILVSPCLDGLVREVVDGCFGQCVDPTSCLPPPLPICGDGTTPVCLIVEPPCPDGLIRESVGGCFGQCVDPVTCEPPIHQGCGDGTAPVCLVLTPPCPDGLIRETRNHCFGECVDPTTCLPPPTICCDPDDRPEFTPEPLECCANGTWQMTGSGSPCADLNLAVGVVCEPTPGACCDVADMPGFNNNPFCIEGATCCGDGEWKCNAGNGSSTCESAGDTCDVIWCDGILPLECPTGGLSCVDYPLDSCDPSDGGGDCIGMCL